MFSNCLFRSLKVFRTSFIRIKLDTRSASQYKRSNKINLPREHLETLKALIVGNPNQTNKQWNEVRQSLIGNFKNVTENNVDVVILGVFKEAEHLPYAKKYLNYLQANGKAPNAAFLGRLLKIYNAVYQKNGELTEDEEDEILDIYKSLKQKHNIFDATTCENLIHGLVATKYWEEAHDYIKMTKLTAIPSVSAYTELASKAFKMAHFEMGWNLLEDMIENHKQPKCEILISYLDAIFKDSLSFTKNLEKLFKFLQQSNLVITDKVSNHIKLLCSMHPAHIKVKETGLTNLGKCNNCGKRLQNLILSKNEFSLLRESFLSKVLIRKDVFQKSSPAEVEKFINFVSRTSPYDCVIDGLNVAYSHGSNQSPAVLASLVASVVKYFTEKNKKVLVLGRKHMNGWPKSIMNYVYKNAQVFLTENLSHDDPFLLYATLHSGEFTDFFSRDLMRSHAFLLGDNLKPIFRRWQQLHQYSLITQTEKGKILVKEPVRYLLYAHKAEDSWHLPCKELYSHNPPDTFEIPVKWLCLQLKN